MISSLPSHQVPSTVRNPLKYQAESNLPSKKYVISSLSCIDLHSYIMACMISLLALRLVLLG